MTDGPAYSGRRKCDQVDREDIIVSRNFKTEALVQLNEEARSTWVKLPANDSWYSRGCNAVLAVPSHMDCIYRRKTVSIRKDSLRYARKQKAT